MFTYLYKIYNQLKTLYSIKTHIENIYKIEIDNDENEPINENEKRRLELLQSLKNIIFKSGSLYIKFFQSYISKVKANIIHIDTTESKISIKLINYFEDIFEQCPYHDLEHTINIFKESMLGIELIEDLV